MHPLIHPQFTRGSGVVVGRNRASLRHDGEHRYNHCKLDMLQIIDETRATTHIHTSWKIHELQAYPSKAETYSIDAQVRKNGSTCRYPEPTYNYL